MNTSIQSSQLTAVINHHGAELISLKSNAQKEFIWEGDPKYWGKHSPVLFPIVGTLKDNRYQYKGKTYYLPRHGFARDHDFALVDKTSSSATFSLRASHLTKVVYPFDFELQICFTIEADRLTTTYKINNKTAEVMPFSVGAHPAFALPKPFENYSLEFESQETLQSHMLNNDLLSDDIRIIPMQGKQLPLTYTLFEDDALIFKRLNSQKITILENRKPIIGFEFADFTNFGIWTKPGAPFVCLEPWLGYSDTMNSDGNLMHKEAIQFLQAQKEFVCSFKIEIL